VVEVDRSDLEAREQFGAWESCSLMSELRDCSMPTIPELVERRFSPTGATAWWTESFSFVSSVGSARLDCQRVAGVRFRTGARVAF